MGTNIIAFPQKADRDLNREQLEGILAKSGIALLEHEKKEIVEAVAGFVDSESNRKIADGVEVPAECADVIRELAQRVHNELLFRAVCELLKAYVFFYSGRYP